MLLSERGAYCLTRLSEPTARAENVDIIGEPGWDRTNDLLIKSQLLYH